MLKKEIYNFYIPIIKKYKILFVLMAFSWIISWVTSVVVPVLLKIETDQLVSKKNLDIFWNHFWAFEFFVIILLAILIVDIAENILSSLSRIFSSTKEEMLQNDIEYELFSRMQNMEIWKSMNSRYKYISEIVSTNFWVISSDIIWFPRNIFNFIIQLFWITAVFAYFDIRLLLVVIISSIIWFLIENISKKLRTKYEIDWKFSVGRKISNYSRLFKYNFSKLAISWWLLTTLKNYQKVLLWESKKNIRRDFTGLIWDIQNLLNNNFMNIILKLIVWYGVFAWTNSVWMVVLVVSSMWVISQLLGNIFWLRFIYREFLVKQESILLMLKMCSPAWDYDFDEKINNIELKNLKFSYPNMAIYEKEYIELLQRNILWKSRNRRARIDDQIKTLVEVMEEETKQVNPEVFSWVDIKFEKWKVYWLVWKNWVWKTSLMYLLSWFFKGYSWDIFYNWVNTKDFSTPSFLKRVSFLTQTPFDLERWYSVRESILLWSDRDIDDVEIFSYLEKFWLLKKIKKHKKWLDAELWDDIEFSGWEKQIIAIIRLLLQDRDIIIMDEWTNQLDAENEVLVMNEFLKNKQDKIIIFITHRMSTISKADEIYCLEDWIITDFWTHKELLKDEKNAYARFYKAQVLVE